MQNVQVRQGMRKSTPEVTIAVTRVLVGQLLLDQLLH